MNRTKSKQARPARSKADTPAQVSGALGYVAQPTDAVSLQRNDYLAATLAAAIALVVYLRTLAPTLTGDDSGEFIAAAYTLGIAHPPGYPLWCMLGKLFTIILPFNSIAWRVAFVSSFFGAATCFVVCLIVIKLTANRIAGVAAGAALAVSAEFWKWNVVAETYSLNAFLMVLGMLLLLRWYETRQDKLLYGFAFAYGLGLCNHHTMHFMGPVFALFILSIDRRPWHHWGKYLVMATIALAVWGIIHLYLPIRAMADPYCNFGDPRTLDRFWAVVTRKAYQGRSMVEPRSLERFMEQCWLFLTQYMQQFTPWMAWIPLLGIYPLWKRNRYAAGLVCGSLVYIALGTTLIINTKLDRISVWLNSKFWIPAYVMATILIGMAIAWIASLKPRSLPRLLPRTFSLKPAAALLGIALFALALRANYEVCDKSNYYFAYDYAKNLAKTMDERAIFFAHNDHSTFAFYYLQAIEKSRLDVTLFASDFVNVRDPVNQILPPELHTQPGTSPSGPQTTAIGHWLVQNTARPVYYSVKCNTMDFPRVKMVDTGLLCRMAPKEWMPPKRDYWSEYAWHTLDESKIHGDFTAEYIVSDYHLARARDFFNNSDALQGSQQLETAIRVAGQNTTLLNNIGAVCNERGLAPLAKTCFLKALNINPSNRVSLRNLAVVCAGEGDFAGTRDAFDCLLRVNERKFGKDHPVVAGCLNNLGGALLFLGDLDDAYACLSRALNIDKAAHGGNDRYTGRDLNNLAIVLEKRGNVRAAQEYRTQAIEILARCLGENHPSTRSAHQGAFIESIESAEY